MPNFGNIAADVSSPDYLTTSLLSMFPTICCLTPVQALSNMKAGQISKSGISVMLVHMCYVQYTCDLIDSSTCKK